MKVLFPNPYGYKLPEKNRVASLQDRFYFSDEYATFLLTQNGLSFDKLEEDSANKKYLENSKEEAKGHADIRALYGFDSGGQYYDLEDNLKSFIFDGIFFPIGVDYAGNELVEILAGKYKGFIASLDHDMYTSFSSFEGFIKEFELDGLREMSIEAQTDILADEELGLAWHFAKSINDFVELCIHCDHKFSGFVVEAIELESDA